jgi:Zn-dependent peptidase ImmA (M78 family)
MPRVAVKQEVLDWAVARSGKGRAKLVKRFAKLGEWERGESDPTLKQLENFARATYTPLGYLFLEEPPEDKLPIRDFRTVMGHAPRRPSPNLLDTVYLMQRRQDWMREFLELHDAERLDFIGSATLRTPVIELAGRIRAKLGFGTNWAALHSTWEDALRAMKLAIEELRVLVFVNGIVGNNTSRALDSEEFRGFVLTDSVAPLIFVNGNDAKGAQMFTFAHELVHLWLGETGVFALPNLQPGENRVEEYCNQVAAEFLIPAVALHEAWNRRANLDHGFQPLARQFKVSALVAARRALDERLINWNEFMAFYRSQGQRAKKKLGGDFFKTQNNRVGVRFAMAVDRATREGSLLYRDAYSLTGLTSDTFKKYLGKIQTR